MPHLLYLHLNCRLVFSRSVVLSFLRVFSLDHRHTIKSSDTQDRPKAGRSAVPCYIGSATSGTSFSCHLHDTRKEEDVLDLGRGQNSPLSQQPRLWRLLPLRGGRRERRRVTRFFPEFDLALPFPRVKRPVSRTGGRLQSQAWGR